MSNTTTIGRNTNVVAAVAFAGFAAVLLAIEALAVHGQLDFGRHVLGLDGAYVYVVPVALEGGTLVSATLALWATLTGDPTGMHRFWTYIFLGGAAAANWIGALAADRGWIAAAYLAATCVAALRMWHAILHRIRRAELRKTGAVEAPLPRFRALRWLIAPAETFAAWRLAVREGVVSPDDALRLVRDELTVTPPTTSGGVDLDELPSKRAKIEHAAGLLNTYDVAPVRGWLSERGVTTDYSNAARVLRDLASKNRRANVKPVDDAPVAAPVAVEG